MKSLTRRISSFTLLAVFGIIMANHTAVAEKSQEIYKWTDQDGRVHYAARPGDKSAKKMHFGSKIFHSQTQAEKTAKAEKENEEENKERTKICQDSKDTLAKYKKAPFLYRYDPDRKQKVRLTEAESKDAYLQVEKDISYWCNPPQKSAETETEQKAN